MDLTPHLVTGAAIGARVKRRGVALILALASEPLLDTVPHFHVGWISGRALFAAADIGVGLVLAGVIALRWKSLWPLVTAVVAALPDAPGLREGWDSVFGVLPHPQWGLPWGIVTQVVVIGVALLVSMEEPAKTTSRCP